MGKEIQDSCKNSIIVDGEEFLSLKEQVHCDKANKCSQDGAEEIYEPIIRGVNVSEEEFLKLQEQIELKKAKKIAEELENGTRVSIPFSEFEKFLKNSCRED